MLILALIFYFLNFSNLDFFQTSEGLGPIPDLLPPLHWHLWLQKDTLFWELYLFWLQHHVLQSSPCSLLPTGFLNNWLLNLKTEAICSSETLGLLQSIQCYSPKTVHFIVSTVRTSNQRRTCFTVFRWESGKAPISCVCLKEIISIIGSVING
jgi:hypothetical protein